MILKVSLKRTKEGKSIEATAEYKDWLFEYPIIKKKRTAEGFQLQFLLEGRKDEKDHAVIVDKVSQDYEILNDQGVCIEKCIDVTGDSPNISFTINEDGTGESEIIQDALIERLIREAKERKELPPYSFIVSRDKVLPPGWVRHIYDTFPDIMYIGAKNLPVNEFILRKTLS